MSIPVGRHAELERAGDVIATSRDHFCVLLLEGAPGIGKTAVFDAAVSSARADGVLVLACRAAQAEAKMALSAIADLMETVPAAAFEALAVPQRRALDVALLRADPHGEPVGDRALAAAVRTIIVGLSQQQPILIAIDDVQWLDRSSAAVLGYVLRRLSSERVGLLATRRTAEPAPLRLEELVGPGAFSRETIGPLSMGSIHHVIKQQLGTSLARPMLMRIYQASGGNPLFALEIGRILADAGPLPAGQPLPIPADVESLVRRRMLRLPARTREVLLIAAALAEPHLERVRTAVGRPIDDDLELARVRGIAAEEAGVLRFRHPLFGSALYAAVPASRRRRLHGLLASVVTDAEERARHLALAVTGHDEAVAQVVHATAREAARRGDPTAAMELLELSLAIGDADGDTRAERIYDLAESLAYLGENIRARQLLDGVNPWRGWPPSVHGPALELILEVEYWTNGFGPELDRLGEHLLSGALPPEVRARVHANLAGYTDHDLPRALEHAEAAIALLETLGEAADPLVTSTVRALRVRNRLLLGHGFDREEMRRALELEERVPPGQRRLERASDAFGQWVKYADEVDEARRRLEAAVVKDMEVGKEKAALTRIQHLALTECLAGNLHLAREHALRACALHDQQRQNILGYAYAIRAIVDAHLGDAHAVYAVDEMYRRQGMPIHLLVALGLLELSLGHDQAAVDHYARALEMTEAAGLREPGIHRIHANAVEAAVATGNLKRAEELTTYLEDHGRRTGHRWSLATGSRCRALLHAAAGDLELALAAGEQAVRWHDDLSMAFEWARTLLVKGVLERRARLRRRSKESLTAAAESFETMGARIWAHRARGELDRIGLRRSAREALTEGERRCAELAATGLTNREVAAALFISPKTVEANLARAYRKLGIGSRAELGSRMRELLQA